MQVVLAPEGAAKLLKEIEEKIRQAELRGVRAGLEAAAKAVRFRGELARTIRAIDPESVPCPDEKPPQAGCPS